MNIPGIPQVGIDYLRKAAKGNLRDTIRIQRPDEPVYDPITGYAVGVKTNAPGYEGKAHIHPVTSGGTVWVGEEPQALMTMQVSLPWDATPIPREEEQIYVLAAEDPALLNKVLRITDVGSGGIGFPVRVLTCTFLEDNPYNPGA